MKFKAYLSHTGDLFCGGLGDNEETAQYRKRYYGSSDRLRSVFQDKEMVEKYQNGDIFLQFSLSLPLSVKRGDYAVALLDMNYDPFRFSDKTPKLLSYKIGRKNKVDTYTIRVKKGAIVFETTFDRTEDLRGISSLYRIALRQNDEVEIWAVDYWISSIKGNFYDIFKPVGPSDPEYTEPTSDKLKEAKAARFDAPGGIGFYGQGYELEEYKGRGSFSYLHLSNSMVEVDVIRKDFSINLERRLMAAIEIGETIQMVDNNKEQADQELDFKDNEEANKQEDADVKNIEETANIGTNSHLPKDDL